MTVAQAADALRISAKAVRGRIRRGTLRVEREAGTVYVLLDDRTNDDQPTVRPGESDALTSEREDRIADLHAHIADLRGQLDAERTAHEQTRRLLGRALEWIPALPAGQTSEDEAQDADTVTRTGRCHDGTGRRHGGTSTPVVAAGVRRLMEIYTALIGFVGAALGVFGGYVLGNRRLRYERLHEQQDLVIAELPWLCGIAKPQPC